MNIVSCETCGVLLDTKRLRFADDIHEDDGAVNLTLAAWNQNTRDFQAYVPCPVCKEPVFKEQV